MRSFASSAAPLLPSFLRLLRLFAAIPSVRLVLSALGIQLSAFVSFAQVSTQGFLNLPRPEAPGTLLSHPVANGSEPIGRTTSINYLNGWIIVGAEDPGSRPGSDRLLRVYDISDPTVPVRRHPSDFGLNYPNNWWIQGNYGWNAHGTAQHNDLLLPGVLRVASFGGPVQLGGTAGIPSLAQLPLGYNRSAQAGPWLSTQLWYDIQDLPIEITKPYLQPNGFVAFQNLATLDHVGSYGGGDWHSMFFGDLLIFARSGVAGADGVVVYRLQYDDFDDPAARSITPHFVGALPGGFHGYWPNLFSDGTGLYVVGSTTDILDVADITQTTHPALDGSIRMSASLVVPNFTNASYPTYQDQFAFIHNRKIDMTRLIAGDANPVALTLDEAATGVNTSQMSLVLGNLWLTGGYPVPGFHQGMGVWVHQQAPDTTPPRVAFHIPQANRVNYPRHAPLSFLIHEHPRRGGPRNGVDFLVRPVAPGVDGAPDTLGAPVSGFLIHDFSGNLTFTPDAGLAPDTTYQVDFPSSDNGTPTNLNDDIGFADAAGNLIEPYSFRFSTGGGVDSTPPPTFSALTASTYHPVPGAIVTITASATPGTPGDTLEYRFNFDGTWSDWSESPAAQHSYATTGRPRVLVQIRDSHGALVTDSLRLLVITPPAATAPTQSNTLAIGDDPDGRRLWVVNPDAHTVSVLDAATGEKLAEHSTGENSNPRNIARDALGRYWVTCHGTDQLRVLLPDGTTAHTVTLPYGAAPFGVAPSPDGQSLFVTLYGSAQLHRYSAANPASAPATLATPFPTPRAIAVSGDGARVLVTRFISPELEAEVGDFAFTPSPSPALTHTRVIRLEAANTLDGGDRASGVPNYLASIAISPDGTRAAVASKQDNTRRGLLFGVGDLTHETTVRAVVSFIDLAVSNAEIRHTRRDFDNSDSPASLAYTPLGDTLLVALQGNNKVAAIDALSLAPLTSQQTQGATETSPAVLTFELSAGLAPQGLLIDAPSARLFTQNFMGRSVTVRDAAPFLAENRTSLPVLATTPTVAVEPLSPEVLLGKQIFYNAADPRMSADSYISCATCHVDGGTDGRVWDFTGRGEGLRRTTDLRGRSGLGHGNVHWSANFDEIQDFEHDIRGPFGGTGFLDLTPQQFAAQHPGPATGKTGLSPELDALAAYVSSLTPATTPRSPARNPDGTLTAAALRGRDVFNAQDCASCHSGPARTDSAAGSVSTPNLHDVGTLSALSGLRLGGPLAGVDTPTLHGLHATRSFLHHGEAETLDAVFSYAAGALRLAADAERITPASVAFYADNPNEGGGGFVRGLLGGGAAAIGAGSPTPGLRFTGIDGGANGGPARLALRYVRQYNNGTALLRINGAEQTLNVLRQYPDNGWMTSGWRWITVETTLQPGAANTIEVLRGNGDLQLNAILVANADDLAAAQPHRRVLSLSAGDRDDLLAYLRQLDNRDDTGAPLPAPAPPAPGAPTIVTPPESQTLAVGNSLLLTVAVGGTGPFTYQWLRSPSPGGPTAPVGTNSPELSLPSVTLADGAHYKVRITNFAGETLSAEATVTINPALSLATATLPTFTVGRAYDHALEAVGGVDTRAWSLVSGPLPAGLALSADGRIHGTPTAPARAAFTIRVADGSGSATRALTLDVRPVGGFDTDPDLVLHYTFDEGSGTRVWDSSAAGNDHGTTVPAAAWSPGQGRFGGAYGSSNLSALVPAFFPANQSDLDFNARAQAFTFSIWVRTTTTESYRTILSKDGTSAEGWPTQFRLWTTDPATSLQAVSGGGWTGSLATSGANTINNGQWHHLALVNYLDGATWRARLYQNGVQLAQWNTGATTTVGQLLRVGDTSNGWNGWAGQLDDLRIYRRALTPAEIAGLHAAPATPASYDTWLAALPTPLPAGHRSPLADPDADGRPNLLEYALSGDPMSSGDTGIPACALDNATQRLNLTFTRHRPDLDYVVEATSDLASTAWTPIATNPVPVGQQATVQDPVSLADSPRRFLRLRVSER